MWGYNSRLQKDYARWKSSGWLTPAGEAGIQAELAAGNRSVVLPSVLAVLAAVLLGFAAMSFVASNWQAIPRLGRLAILLSGLWLAYIGAAAAFSRKHDWLGHAAVLTGTSIFGANIMLIAQMFHMDGNPPDAVLVWAAGALLAALAIPSAPSLGLAAMLVGLWAGWETSIQNQVFWPFLLGWAAIAVSAYALRWSPGRHFAGLLFAGWAVSLGPFLPEYGGFKIGVAVGLGIMALGALLDTLQGDGKRLSRVMLSYGLIIAGAALFAIQFVEQITNQDLVLWAIVALVLALGAIAWGLASDNRGLLWLGYIGFAAEVLGLYFKTVGTLLGNSAFFLSASVIVMILAAVAYRIHNRAAAAGASP